MEHHKYREMKFLLQIKRFLCLKEINSGRILFSLLLTFPFSVILQGYQTEISNEHVILGNDAIFKCSIPSFVSDFVTVQAWIDNEANAFEHKYVNGNFNPIV